MFLENLEFIVVNYQSDLDDILLSFKRAGVTKLPDGRKIEDVVFTKESWSRRSS